MSCLTQRDLVAYLEDKLSPAGKRKLEGHIDRCASCQRQLEQWIEGLDLADEAVWGRAAISESLDQKIISVLPPHPVSVLNQATNSQKLSASKKRRLALMKKSTIVAAAFAVAVSGVMFFAPAVPTYVNAVFTSNSVNKATPENAGKSSFLDQAVDPGIKQAVRNGFGQPGQLSVTDQGMTFQVNEIVADPLRIAVLATIKNENGKQPSNPRDLLWDRVEIQIKDKKGKALLSSSSKDALEWSRSGSLDGHIILQHELRSLFSQGAIPDTLNVEFSLEKIGDKKENWKMSVPVDMTKAKAATKTYAINQTYTTPQGLKLDLKQVTFAPSGVEMVIDRSWKGSGKMDYSYQLVNGQGAVAAAWDSTAVFTKARKQVNVINSIKWRHSLPVGKTTRDFHYFHSIEESKNLLFKLQSVYGQVPTSFKAKLDLASLGKKPIVAEEQGDRFIFTNAEKPYQEPGKYAIAFEGTLAEDSAAMFPFSASSWFITDETGKKYDAQSFINETGFKNGRAYMKGVLQVLGVKSPPETLTITSDKRMIEYRNIDWTAPILQK